MAEIDLRTPLGDLPDDLIVNGHLFVHVAACPCPRIQAEVARLAAWATPADPWAEDDENADAERPCPICGSTETTELHDERQSITVCAECGSDE